MKLFVGVLLVLYLVEINGRHFEEKEDVQLHDGEDRTEFENRLREHATQTRHRRRSRQSYGYDYSPPFFADNRRDFYTRQQEETLSRIVKSLDEIISYISRPPPPPQPIYIPYPVVQFVPCGFRPVMKPNDGNSTSGPNLPPRGDFDQYDTNQIWGSSINPPIFVDDGEDGARPINFDPVEPSRPTSRPPPAVDHGSNQAGIEQATQAPAKIPNMCQAAILSCCSISSTASQRTCFNRYGCIKTYSTNRACQPDVIKQVLDLFKKAYGPVNNN